MTRVDLSAPVAALLRHCELYASDRHIAFEFDSVESVAASDADAAVLRRYRRARQQAPGFSRGSYTANSHRGIPADVLAGLTEAGSGESVSEQECQSCGHVFTARRSDARSCSPRCRQRRRRSGPRSMSRMHASEVVPQVPVSPGTR